MPDLGHPRGNINTRGYIKVSLGFTVEKMYFFNDFKVFNFYIENKSIKSPQKRL